MVLRVSNINISFGGVQALVEVNFEVYEGEILAVIGPNGAGKTTILNCINGFYRAEPGGSIVYRHCELMGKKTHEIARLGVARVFQGIQTYSGMTSLDNLMTGRHIALNYGPLSSFLYFCCSKIVDDRRIFGGE